MDAATIEETNRIRVSLGMKPLPVPGNKNASRADESSATRSEEAASTLESRQAQSYDNFKKHRDAETTKRKREERATAIRKARDEAQRFAILEGKGLGDANGKGDLDAKSWLTGQKKRQKKIDKARRLEEELAAAEAAAAAAVQYTSKDLAGIKVAHEQSEFLDGQDQILTLKDTTIDQNEEEGDELENLGLREQEKLSERLDLKKKRPGYNPNDEEEEAAVAAGGGRGAILAQYDDEINGKKGKKFTLNDSGTIAELADILGEPEKRSDNTRINLDDVIGDVPMSSDYLAPSEIKVKKPKKKKKETRTKGTRQRQRDDDDDDIFPPEAAQIESSAMQLDSKDTVSRKRIADTDTFIDDDDLQASLASQRKNALKKRKKIKPEDIAKQIKNEEARNDVGGGDGGDDFNDVHDGGLVIGEISEFVSGLTKREDEDRKPVKRPKAQTKSPSAAEDHPMADAQEEEEEEEEEEEVEQGGGDAAASVGIKEEEDDESRARQGTGADMGIEEEKIVGEGMGAALALLRERGLIEESQGSEYETFRDRQEFLARKRALEEELDEQTRQQRERDRASGRLDRMSVREREEWARQQNQWRDQQQSRRMAELFSANYKPNVQLKYSDEHGRSLDRHEAFKHLSHQFHGKGSGKGKTEKRLKKIEDERRREAQSLFDVSANGGMNAATAQQLKKRREAGVRLA